MKYDARFRRLPTSEAVGFFIFGKRRVPASWVAFRKWKEWPEEHNLSNNRLPFVIGKVLRGFSQLIKGIVEEGGAFL